MTTVNPKRDQISLSQLIVETGAPLPTFRAPWQAQAFAIVVALRQTGRLNPVEWADALGHEIHSDGPKGGSTEDQYFLDWLRALELVVMRHGMADESSLERYRRGWERAIQRTPHGAPLSLEQQDHEPK